MQGNPERGGRNSVCHREAADGGWVGRLHRVIFPRSGTGLSAANVTLHPDAIAHLPAR